MYSQNEKEAAAQIRAQYETRETTKLGQLRKLDRKVKRPCEAVAYTFGTAGALVLGIGLCLAMKVIGNLVPFGIVVGCAGIAMVSVTHLIYGKMLASRKKKYAPQILSIGNDA